MQERNQWIDIITKMYQDLHTSDRVMHVSKESDKKRDRIINYFNRLEEVHKKAIQSKSDSALKMLKQFYYDLYIIKPEDIPEAYFENEQRIMRERGYGDIELTQERKNILINQIIEDQKASLEPWIDYFLFDEESQSYDMWERYWVFQGLQKLGKYDKEKQKFNKRDKTTVYPFPPVEREAIFTTIHLMEEYIKNKKTEEEIKSALGEGNFKTLYEYSIKQIMKKGEKNNPKIAEGKWIKYEQGTDYNILRDSLQGYYTGWCTAAGENFAKTQLENGDFYVYYTLDENNEPKVPRIAIRMEGHNTIGEIRGIADNQNMEPEMIPILNEKLKEFPDSDKYYKKEYDMQRLTTIDNKVQKGFELDKEDLKFLYEIENKIEGFGYCKDPRIEEIKSQRNLKKDFVHIYNCKEEEIGTCIEDLNNPSIKVYVGNLNLWRLTGAEGVTFPKILNGYLNLWNLRSAEGLILPYTINGYLALRSLTNPERLVLPYTINGYLDLWNLTSAEGVTFPKILNGDLELHSLTNPEGLVLPHTINGDLDLWNLTSAKGVTFPQTLNGDLILRSLTSAKGLILPHNFPLEHLICSEEIKNEILNNPEKYYKKETIENKANENDSEITPVRHR